jgi:uncharacterized protein
MMTIDSPCIDLDEVEVRDSRIHGLGAFARRGMQPGHVVGRYEGRRYSPTEEGEAEVDHHLTYLFGLSDGSLINGAEGGNATRHINHSCSPNCQAVEERDEDGEIHIVIRTLRRVKAGEELFIDYRLEVPDEDVEHYPCRCGTAGCRGTMAAPVEA